MTIYIPKKDIERCLEVTKHVCDVYSQRILGGKHSVKAIDCLIEISSELSDKPIEFLQSNVSCEDEQLKGYFVAKEDKYQVVLLSNLNYCWRRFVLCKELFHVFLDTDEFRSMDMDAHLAGLYTVSDTTEDIGPIPALTSEKIAEFAAMEFLFPYSDRRQCLAAGRESFDIADTFKIPLVLVEKYLQERNMAMLGKYYLP